MLPSMNIFLSCQKTRQPPSGFEQEYFFILAGSISSITVMRLRKNGFYRYHFVSAKGREFINNETAVEHPKADSGFVSPVFVAHFV